ncbi:hypothetical protein BOTBODRAFT_174281 [Botryobasidium botryosum FD-172 SS1]|uniref:G-protein coupled receptors family 1 profile domain-containing protein n=1 Tax=Botryobasidium botryosum (strain FD-172 SS1) TaxID=930990 RepID=A0A067MTB1_BOTB1|nr:hypothetical protein BOTBODRAFT_174281 [Botryobasidium botryosum FD-172 SS1]
MRLLASWSRRSKLLAIISIFATIPDAAALVDGGPMEVPITESGTKAGLVLIVLAACVSVVAVLFLLCHRLVPIIRSLNKGDGEFYYWWSHMDYYFLSLMIADLIQASGAIINSSWISHHHIVPGRLCTAQAVLKQLGDDGVAFSTLAISIHTFSVLFFKWSPPTSPRLAACVVAAIWTFCILVVVIGSSVNPGYYGPNGYWCWITEKYHAQQIASEYAWMWATAFLNVLLYIPLFFILRGNILVTGYHIEWRRTREKEAWETPDRSRRDTAIARQMLWYPLAYIVVILPIAIARYLSFYGHHVSFAWTVFADVLFGLSGLFNVVLYTFTRPSLLRTRRRRSSAARPRLSNYTDGSTTDLESGGITSDSTKPVAMGAVSILRHSQDTSDHSPTDEGIH